MRKTILYILGVVLLGASYFGAKALVEGNVKQKPPVAEVIKSVFTETVRNTTIPIEIPANGNLIAKNRLELYSEVQGVFQYSSHDFKPGQAYRKGETLFSLDASEYYASVQSARSEFYNLVTSLMPDLRLDYPEAYPVWQQYLSQIDLSKSLPPLPEIQSEKVNYFITGRGVTTSYYDIKNREQRLGKYSIRAPFGGVVTEALVTRGTLIRSGQKLGEFIDTSVFEVELSIGKTYSDLLEIGEEVELSTLNDTNRYTGKVSRINGKIDQATQTIKVFVEVDGDGLKEGMYLEALLEAKDEENAIRISRKLMVNESEVYVVRDSVLDLIRVQPVYFSSKEVVVKGIPDGTLLLSRPVPGAYAGMKVKIVEETAPSSDETAQN